MYWDFQVEIKPKISHGRTESLSGFSMFTCILNISPPSLFFGNYYLRVHYCDSVWMTFFFFFFTSSNLCSSREDGKTGGKSFSSMTSTCTETSLNMLALDESVALTFKITGKSSTVNFFPVFMIPVDESITKYPG